MIRDVNMPFNVNEFFKEFIKYIITLLLNIFSDYNQVLLVLKSKNLITF